MATFTTTTFDAQKPDRANPSRTLAQNVVSGDVEFAIVPYTLAGTETTSDTIQICLLPAGAIPVPQLSRVTVSGSPGTALTLKIGTAADDDGWATSIPLTTSARDLSCTLAGAAQPAFLAPTPLAADTGSGNVAVFATPTTATSLTASSVVYFTLAYKRHK